MSNTSPSSALSNSPGFHPTEEYSLVTRGPEKMWLSCLAGVSDTRRLPVVGIRVLTHSVFSDPHAGPANVLVVLPEASTEAKC